MLVDTQPATHQHLPASPEVIDQWVNAQLIGVLMDNMVPSLLAATLALPVLIFMMAGEVDFVSLLIWTGLLVTMLVYRYRLIGIYQLRYDSSEGPQRMAFVERYQWTWGVMGFLWGGGVLLSYLKASPATQFVCGIVVLGLKALAWWMTVFNFDPQSIFSPFEDELLGMIDQGAYDNIDLQHLIFAAGKYHYFNPQDDSDVVEELIFRKEMFGYSMYDTVDGSYQNSFSYWQQFTITLPSPMSFDNRNLFDSALTDTMLQQYSGFGVAFDTFISIQEFWNNPDFTQSSSKSTQTGYAGYGSYSFTSSQAVPAPATISLFVPFLLAGLVAVRRRIVAK